jgi:hypothetical protein
LGQCQRVCVALVCITLPIDLLLVSHTVLFPKNSLL